LELTKLLSYKWKGNVDERSYDLDFYFGYEIELNRKKIKVNAI